MDQLQAALDRSIAHASAFTRSLFADDQWDAARVQEFVVATRNLTAATVSAAGLPHAAVVIATCLDGDIHFTAAPRSALQRNLLYSPSVAFTVSDAVHSVMGRGTAIVAAPNAAEAPELVDRLAAATVGGVFTPPGWGGLIYRIDLERIFAN